VSKIVTRQMRASDAADQLRNGYMRTPYWTEGWPHLGRPPARESHAKLLALGPNPDPDEVERIMGGDWTWGHCDECGKRAATTVDFDVNCGEFTLSLCGRCCSALVDKLKEPVT